MPATRSQTANYTTVMRVEKTVEKAPPLTNKPAGFDKLALCRIRENSCYYSDDRRGFRRSENLITQEKIATAPSYICEQFWVRENSRSARLDLAIEVMPNQNQDDCYPSNSVEFPQPLHLRAIFYGVIPTRRERRS